MPREDRSGTVRERKPAWFKAPFPGGERFTEITSPLRDPEVPPGRDGAGCPVAAFSGITVGGVALLVGAAAYLWKTGRFLLLLGFWRRFSETGRQS